MRHSTSQHGTYQDRSTVKMNNLGFNWTSVTVDKMCLRMRQCSKQYSVVFFPGLARNFANDKKPISCVPESKQFWKKARDSSHCRVAFPMLWKTVCVRMYYISTYVHIYTHGYTYLSVCYSLPMQVSEREHIVVSEACGAARHSITDLAAKFPESCHDSFVWKRYSCWDSWNLWSWR